MNQKNIINALTVDVEDYFQVSAFAEAVKTGDWEKHESRVERNTYRLLELFSEHNVLCTFFVLGWVAERYPKLVSDIIGQGHEVASHGYSHQLVYNQTVEVFREETLRSKKILEDIIQKPVEGYRAASYSITTQSEWALDVLVEAGFKYDSSIFPIRHDRYGMPSAPRKPYRLTAPSGGSLIEFPLTTKEFFNYRLPVAGGGYFRLFPYAFTKAMLASVNKNEQMPFIFYLHPWEVDPEQPRIKAGLVSRFRHYNNLKKCQARLTKLLNEFEFSTVKNVLDTVDIAR